MARTRPYCIGKQYTARPRQLRPRDLEKRTGASRQRGYLKAIRDKVGAIFKERRKLDRHVCIVSIFVFLNSHISTKFNDIGNTHVVRERIPFISYRRQRSRGSRTTCIYNWKQPRSTKGSWWRCSARMRPSYRTLKYNWKQR